MSALFLRNIAAQIELLSRLDALAPDVLAAGQKIAQTLRAGGKLLLCGNGGSAADAQHIAAELTGRFMQERRPLAAVALTTDTSALTCIGNDYSFDEIFARQLQAIARPGDCLIGISTSGNSRNIIRTVEVARDMGVFSIGLLGRDGGALLRLCDQSLIVPSQVTARIQESHILIGHTLCGLIEQELGLVTA
jgi:D-sedoheptulose 7-phosphate isomerase